jgi:hypothetical protein
MNEISPKNWIELQKILFDENLTSFNRYRSNFLYRGVSDTKYGLETSIQRLGTVPSKMEKHLIRNFKKYAPINTLIDNYDNIWNWLSLGQHHGLPTRLLDWTYSPNVALHFATENINNCDKDGVIWRVNYIKMKENYPPSISKYLDENSILVLGTNDLVDAIGKSYEDLKKFSIDENNSIIFFEPPSIDDRIVNQFALFSFMLDEDSNKLEYLKNVGLVDKIIISSSLKWEIRDKLDQANITERIIYPGLDGISKWITRWYTEKEKDKKWNFKK